MTKLHQTGIGRLLDTIKGEVDWTLRNADGSIAAQGHEHNIFLRGARYGLCRYRRIGNWVTLFDDEHPAGIKEGLRCLKVDTLTPTPTQNITPTVGGYTRTHTVSFATPSATRTIRKIGLGGQEGAGGSADDIVISEGGARGVTAYLELTTPVTQLTSQTFELVYRLTLVPNFVKSLNRYNPWTPLNEAQALSGLLNDTIDQGQDFTCFSRYTQGSGFFVDGDLVYRGAPGIENAVAWNRTTVTARDPSLLRWYADNAVAVTGHASNNYLTGPVGMFAAVQNDGGIYQPGDHNLSIVRNRAASFSPVAAYEGTLTSVFKHPAGETYAWNVVGSIALSQGNVEVRGPYIPDNHKSPWHWLHWIRYLTSGDTDPGTEGTYVVTRMAWVGYPYPTIYGRLSSTWDPIEEPRSFITAFDTGWGYFKHQIAFDGEFYWIATWQSGVNTRLLRWRRGSNEQFVFDSVGDTTRFYGFTQPNATSTAMGIASDGAGVTWVAQGNTVLADQKFYRIDNTKPGRQYQRPSGAVLTANPSTFTVDADDEIHAMYPFVVGDVGKKIRIVNTVSNGADTVRTITAYNSPTSVDVDGAAFVTESGMTWHWQTVTTMATNPWPAQVGGQVFYDAANTRLWTISNSGLHYSNDGGATWGTVDETTGLTTALAKTVRSPDESQGVTTMVLGNNSTLYWVDTNNAVNKYVPGVGGPLGTHTRVTVASLPAAPSGYTKGTLTNLIYDAKAPDISADTDGALWVGQDRVAARCFFRMPCGTFSGGTATAYSEVSIGGSVSTYLHASFQNGFALPDGSVYFHSPTYNTSWKQCYFHESTGTLTWVSAGNLLGTPAWYWGAPFVNQDGLLCLLDRYESYNQSDSTRNGVVMLGTPVVHRYNDLTDNWIPFLGSGAQFNAKYGTTLGGARKCHAGWQKLLRGSEPNNLELRFIQAGGAVAPADEFKADESSTFGAAFGVSRTNVQDLTWRADTTLAETTLHVEEEAIKTAAVAPGSLKCYYWRVATSLGETAKPLGVSAYPTNIPELTSGGVNYGWLPSFAALLSGGTIPNFATATYGAVAHSQALIGLDLGAGPPAVSRLHALLSTTSYYYYFHNYYRTSADRGRARVYYSDDNIVWTEVPEVRFQLNGAGDPDAGYKYVYIDHNPTQGLTAGSTTGLLHFTFDLETAGLSVGNRTHRYWQIHVGNNGTANTSALGVGAMYVTDSNNVPLGGFTTNHRIDEALDTDLAACKIVALDFIQTRTGLSGQGGINTVDDGDADGRTNTVTIASGSFDTGVISTVTDYLAWKESPGVGNGYIRQPRGVNGRAMNWGLGVQARSRILSATATTIVVADDIIPDSLAAVDFEIRRPATGTVLGAGTLPFYDNRHGYLQFHSSDVGREFRVTRKQVIRLP